MKRFLPLLFAATVLTGAPVLAQDSVPAIALTATTPLQLPADIYLGEVAGVATNSKGEVFVHTRTGTATADMGGARAFAHGGTRLFKFNAAGKYVGEIGKGVYGFLVGQQVRIDPQDNIRVVDQYSNMIMKFDPQGQFLMQLGRKPESINVPEPAPAANNGAGQQTDLFQRPADVAWDSAGNIYVADGLINARVVKFDKNGVFIRSWGTRGTEPGQFAEVHSIQVDANGNVYVADRGNNRIQVFDSDGNVKAQLTGVGNPMAICITSGPHPYIYSSNSNRVNDIDNAGEIYKLELDGKVIGKFGRAGKLAGEFGTVNEIDCRNPSQLFVAEIGNFRVLKLTLR